MDELDITSGNIKDAGEMLEPILRKGKPAIPMKDFSGAACVVRVGAMVRRAFR